MVCLLLPTLSIITRNRSQKPDGYGVLLPPENIISINLLKPVLFLSCTALGSPGSRLNMTPIQLVRFKRYSQLDVICIDVIGDIRKRQNNAS
ncbi:hypothetical protein ATANTOWER_019506 [Ataeniobius toweri]|uniref:Uncharacterized protein n=1 Tax=Ataeniobius toweri TaxID=208326 RepID=A0ABU7BQW8_9TELE|nr:hypothetical protein [Ataeniobius toweri]